MFRFNVIEEDQSETRYLIFERKYYGVTLQKILNDIIMLIAPQHKLLTQQAGRNKYRRFLKYTTKPKSSVWECQRVIFQWLREDVLKNEKYNHLIRNTRRKPNPKPRPKLRPIRSDRLIEPFFIRLSNQMHSLLMLSSKTTQKLNSYNDLIRPKKEKLHFIN